jgi:hypothetical protein
MIEGSGSGSIPLTSGSGSDPGGPKTCGSGSGSGTLRWTVHLTEILLLFLQVKKELLTFHVMKFSTWVQYQHRLLFNNFVLHNMKVSTVPTRTSKVGSRTRSRFLTFKVQCLDQRNLPPTKAFSYLVSQLGI